MAQHTDPAKVPWYRAPTVQPPETRYLDGKAWELIPGVDFTSPLPSFRAKMWKLATAHGLSIQTRFINGVLYLRAYEDVPPTP